MAVAAAPSSAATGAQFDGDTLQIFGDNGEQTLAIVNQPSTYVLDIGNNGTADFTFDRSTFSKIEVDAKGGNDRIDLINGGGALDKPITVDGGAGNDTLRGAAGAEKLLGGSGDDDIDGNIGNDTVDGGTGNDRIEWDPGDGSDTVDGASAPTRSTSTAPTSASRSASPPTALAHASRATSRRSTWTSGASSRSASAPSEARTPSPSATCAAPASHRVLATSARSDGTADGVADNVIVQGTDAPDRFDVGAPRTARCASTARRRTSRSPPPRRGQRRRRHARRRRHGRQRRQRARAGLRHVDGGDGTDTSIYKGTGGDDEIGLARNGHGVAASPVTAGGSSTTGRSRASGARPGRRRHDHRARTASGR